MSQALQSLNVDVAALDWEPGSPWYGPGARFGGREVIEIKVLSDRRQDGGGVAYLLHFMPPAGKLIKIVAIARSDEHIVTLEGGRGTKSGERLRIQGQYGLNPNGKPHSAMISTDTTALVIYTGERDEVLSTEVLDLALEPAAP
jgi:hypothetical protein